MDQFISLLLFVGGVTVGGIIMWFWGFNLIDKMLERKDKRNDA